MNLPDDVQITPFIRQWLEAKEQAGDAIVFFRMGDFYEMFFDDAITASRILEITLTSRSKKEEGAIPMAGVPHHSMGQYLARLVREGHRVAICEQMEDPALAKGIVKRSITRIVTPGVILDPDNLDSDRNNYLAALAFSLGGTALAYLDASCGEFRGTLVEDPLLLKGELARIEPAELLVAEEDLEEISKLQDVLGRTVVTPRPRSWFEPDHSQEGAMLMGLDTQSPPPVPVQAAGSALLGYLRETQRSGMPTLGILETYRVRDYMVLDDTAVADLELLQTIIGRERRGTLLWVLDKTVTPMGKRLLKRWITYPLIRPDSIDRRLDAVEELVERAMKREQLRDHLKEVGDIERLLARMSSGQANARDLKLLGRSMAGLAPVRTILLEMRREGLRELAGVINPLEELTARLQTELVDEPPVSIRDGGMFQRGISEELDELMDLSRGGKEWIARYEAAQRERTGISSLKVKFNKVFGYNMEITKANLHLVPEDFIRKQTMVNAERFYTVELKEYEEKVMTAQEKQAELEQRMFQDLLEEVTSWSRALSLTAGGVGRLDVLLSLAKVAHENGYVRPKLDHSGIIDLRDNRHPVVENLLAKGRFVPNDVRLDVESSQLMLITGPNMAGKSTVMRQVALTIIMAQMGSFVPASQAQVGIADRVFTRVGATDALARGLSTFMVEMNETSEILRKATRRSLVILDEIGRGTSTYDGLSIAWAVAEYLHDVLGARTMFATHYHELAELAESRTRIRNWSIAIKEFNDQIFFLHKLVEGGASRSYGVQVARLAGVPAQVISRAKEILKSLEDGDDPRTRKPRPARTRAKPRPGQGNLFSRGQEPGDDEPSPLEKKLAAADPDKLSPLDALTLIYELKSLLGGPGNT